MTLNIQDDGITSNHTPLTARLLPGDQPLWEVSWLPGQPMDRNHALTAMALADATSADAQTGHQLSMNTINYAAKLIGPEPEATGDTSSPHARTEPGKSGQLSDPEAGG
jgi:hypothetical protein